FAFLRTATSPIYTLSLHDALPILQNSLFLPSRDNIEKQDGAEAPYLSSHSSFKCYQNRTLRIQYGELNPSLCQPFTTGLKALIQDRKSTRLNYSHVSISYAVFCLQ